MSVGVQQQQRRGTEAAWLASGKILAAGEIGFATDSKIIKLGDGVNTWDNLSIPYDGRYLPIGGKAADSEMLDGISSGGFLLVGDATTTPTADKVAKRDGSGRMKAATGSEDDDVVNVAQLTASKRVIVIRTVTANFTLQLTDALNMIAANNANYTPSLVCTIPSNADAAFPVGTYIDIVSASKGPVTLTPAAGVTLTGQTVIYGGVSTARLVKTSTDGWLTVDVRQSPPPIVRRKIKPGSDNTVTSGIFRSLLLTGTDIAGNPAMNLDTLGVNEQYNSAVDQAKLYCRRAGVYEVSGQVSYAEATAGRMFAQFRVNDVESFGRGQPLNGHTEMGVNVSSQIPLNVNDHVALWTYYDVGGTRTINDSIYASSYVEWRWLRPL